MRVRPAGTRPAVAIRPFAAEDETGVLELLHEALGGGPAGMRPPEFFRWKHRSSPFGPSLLLVAEADGKLVGLRAFMRWRFVAGPAVLEAVRAVDTATHPDFQGMGIFSRLTRAALDDLEGTADLVFNTPNGKSGPGYLKMGWREVGKMPVPIPARHPLRVAGTLGPGRPPAGARAGEGRAGGAAAGPGPGPRRPAGHATRPRVPALALRRRPPARLPGG